MNERMTLVDRSWHELSDEASAVEGCVLAVRLLDRQMALEYLRRHDDQRNVQHWLVEAEVSNSYLQPSAGTTVKNFLKDHNVRKQ